VIPFSQIQDAVDIDALSKSKTECFQLITEEKNYRFCAMSEPELTRWLGAFKSVLAKRREGEIRGGSGANKTAKEQPTGTEEKAKGRESEEVKLPHR
jgi:hypothetical protein